MTSSLEVIDYDQRATWVGPIEAVIEEVAAEGFKDELPVAAIESVDHAAQFVVERVERSVLIERLSSRLSPRKVRLFHATRVSPNVFKDIIQNGLMPLDLSSRRAALLEIFERHHSWSEVRGKFDAVVNRHGRQLNDQQREDGWVYATFSKQALLQGHCDILKYGAEVDHHIAHDLFGDMTADGLFKLIRSPKLVVFSVPFAEAADAADANGASYTGLPVLYEALVGAWAFNVANPRAIFTSDFEAQLIRAIPAAEIEAIISVDEADIGLPQTETKQRC